MRKFIVLLIASLFLIGCGDADKEDVVEKKSEYTVGDTVEMDGMNITLNGVRYVEGDELFKPDEGTFWIALDITFENTSEKSEYVAGIFNITLKDDEGIEKDQNIWGNLEGSLDGDVLGGEKLRGEKSFVIKGDESEVYAYYKSTFSSNEPIKFVIDLGSVE